MPRLPHPLGFHRVLEPAGALPQSALRLDNDPSPYDNEIVIRVEALSVDSASFRQMREARESTGEPIEAQIIRIVGQRGKLHNPVTGSGGMLIGAVRSVGREHPASGTLFPGERIASLVSLTLTPLRLDRVVAIHEATERVDVAGTAILFARTLFAKLPLDLPEATALAAFDVAGAPAGVAARARPGATVLVIGTGKAGLLCLAAARDSVGAAGRVLAVEPSEPAARRARELGLADAVFALDARDPAAMLAAIEGATAGTLADLVINVANVPGTEASSVLCARDDGAVCFFGMATSFSAAALGAEGLAKPTTLLIGNGYVPGHADYCMDLLRRHGKLRDAFTELTQAPSE